MEIYSYQFYKNPTHYVYETRAGYRNIICSEKARTFFIHMLSLEIKSSFLCKREDW